MLLLMGGFGLRRPGYIAWGASADRPRWKRDFPNDDDAILLWWWLL